MSQEAKRHALFMLWYHRVRAAIWREGTKMVQDRKLSHWVMYNCNPTTRWRWNPPRRNWPAVIVVLHGYNSHGGNLSAPYYLEFSHFYVVGRDGVEHESLPHGKKRLPKWFLDALKPHSNFMPWHMESDAFKKLVDAGTIKADGHEE